MTGPRPKTLLHRVGLIAAAALCATGCAKKIAVAKPPQAPAIAASAPATAPPAPRTIGTPAQPSTTAANLAKSTAPDQATKDQIAALLKKIEDAYFDYNTANIRADAKQTLADDAHTLSNIIRQYPTYKLTVEGFCDERGSAEYNLGLGEARAARAKQFLVDSGIPEGQLLTVSFGKEQQLCSEHDETCWQKNRRIHIVQAQS